MKKIPSNISKKHIVVFDSIFHQKISVLLNYSAEDYAKWLNKNKIKDVVIESFNDFSGWTSEFTTEKETTKRIIFIPRFQWTLEEQGTLIHEIVHVIIKIWQANNIPYNQDTQEFLAHSIANLYEDIGGKLLN